MDTRNGWGPAGTFALLALVTTGCASSPSSAETPVICADFFYSLIEGHGQPTPVAAAEWTARHGQIRLPTTGWTVANSDHDGVNVRSGRSTVHAVRFADKTWAVDSGRLCR
ncbi:hypothetical protein [Calidifontibacter terrae]